MGFSSKPTAGTGGEPSTSEMEVTEVSFSHVVTINGYSRCKKVRNSNHIVSPFTAAGHRWSLLYYPNGRLYEDGDYVSLLITCDGNVDARCTFSVLDRDGKPAFVYSTGQDGFFGRLSSTSRPLGVGRFIKKKTLENSVHVKYDSLRIRCDITFLNVVQKKDEDDVVAMAPVATKFVDVPPSDMVQHLGALLASGAGADVMFEVDGETFGAHRSILAARSPVFRAELLRPAKEGTATSVWVDGVEPVVFRALLHFIYHDEMLPGVDDDDGDAMVMAQHLLAAADRYGLQRMKLICEEKLCGYVDTSTVGAILALAEQHGCLGLKKACLSFLMAGNNLVAAVVTGGFDHVMNSCPSVVKELLLKSCSKN